MIQDTWVKVVDYFRNKLTDPLSRGSDNPWIYAGFPGGGYVLRRPTIVILNATAGESDAPHGIGDTKRHFTLEFELYIFVDSTRYQINTTWYEGATLREYYTNQIVNLLTNTMPEMAAYLSASDIHLRGATTLPYYEDLDEYRKLITFSVDIFKK